MARVGHPCWLVERPGIGAAPWPSRRGPRGGLEEHLRSRLPQIQTIVVERENRAAFWVAHSFGGVILARAAAETLKQEQMAGLVLFASQCEQALGSLRPPASSLMRAVAAALGRFPARRLGLGSEDEPPAAIADACRWTASPAWLSSLSTITVAVLAVVGAGDQSDPPEGCERFIGHMSSRDKNFVTAGIARGFAEDYNHSGIVVSKAARDEIWPVMSEWFHSLSPREDSR